MKKKARKIKAIYEEVLVCDCGGMMEPFISAIEGVGGLSVRCSSCGKVEKIMDESMLPQQIIEYEDELVEIDKIGEEKSGIIL